MLRAYVLDFGGSWDKHLPLVEFSYNNSYHSNIRMTHYEVFYNRPCQSPICWNEVGNRHLPKRDLIQEAIDKIVLIFKNLITTKSRQKNYADNRMKDLEFAVGNHIFFKVFLAKGNMRFGKNGKLNPRFMGPFEVLECIGPMPYRLALPPKFMCLHDVFHVLMLRKYHHDSFHIIPY